MVFMGTGDARTKFPLVMAAAPEKVYDQPEAPPLMALRAPHSASPDHRWRRKHRATLLEQIPFQEQA